jgi:hypothetical protein
VGLHTEAALDPKAGYDITMEKIDQQQRRKDESRPMAKKKSRTKMLRS